MTPEQVIAGVLADLKNRKAADLAAEIAAALRAAGLLPGPDDIVVSREALTALWDAWRFKRSVLSIETGHAIRAALSQPHPEETP